MNTSAASSARLFWAVPVPVTPPVAELFTELERWRTQLKLTRADQVHLTLKFLGDTPSELVPGLCAAGERLPRVNVSQIGCEGLGVFPPCGRPNVLWAGLTHAESLIDLADAIDAAMTALGYAPERRRFHPHLTLARLKLGMPQPMRNWFDRRRNDDFGPVEISELVLYRSQLCPTGSIYTPVWRLPLERAR